MCQQIFKRIFQGKCGHLTKASREKLQEVQSIFFWLVCNSTNLFPPRMWNEKLTAAQTVFMWNALIALRVHWIHKFNTQRRLGGFVITFFVSSLFNGSIIQLYVRTTICVNCLGCSFNPESNQSEPQIAALDFMYFWLCLPDFKKTFGFNFKSHLTLERLLGPTQRRRHRWLHIGVGKASAKPSGGSAPYLSLYQVQHFAFGQRMKKAEGKSDASSRGAHRIGVAGRRGFPFFAYCELFFCGRHHGQNLV